MPTPSRPVHLSIVTTLYKSSSHVDEFYRRIKAAAETLTESFEIVMVDDGSPDNSLALAVEIAMQDPRARVIELSRNFGHFKAMMTAIEHAHGEYVFLIDSDLEEPPELLTQFYELLTNGDWDVVFGQQESRKGNFFERSTGAIAWWLVNKLLPNKVPRNHCTVRLMRANYARALVLHKEHKTAIGGLWVETGFKQVGIKILKLSRRSTSYPLRLRLIVLLDSITSFSERPLYLVFAIGLAILTLSITVSVGLFALWCSGHVLAGWISVMVSVWFLGGLSIFCIGVVGLYVSRIFIETKFRPYTIIRKTYETKDVDTGSLL